MFRPRFAPLAVCLTLAPFLALAEPESPFSGEPSTPSKKLQTEKEQVVDEAKALSARKEYAAAGQRLEAFTTEHKQETGNLAGIVAQARRAARGYADRARWAGALASSVPAARSLLKSLIDPPSMDLDRATSADPRVREIIDVLRKSDPAAATLFRARTIHVTATGDDIPSDQLQLIAERAIESLAGLGFKASPTTGDETLAFTVTRRLNGSIAALIGDTTGQLGGMVSCRVEAVGSWKADDALVAGGIVLTGTGVRLGEQSCFQSAASTAGDGAAMEIIHSFLRVNP